MKKSILVLFILAVTSYSSFSQTKQESIKHLFSLMKTESMLDNFLAPLDLKEIMEKQNSIIKDLNFESDENDPTIMPAVAGEKEK